MRRIINKLKSAAFLSVLLAFISINLSANSPVKSVDADGNVTYSDKPVSNSATVTKVPIHSGPSDNEIEAARQQAQKNIQTAEQIDASNAAEKKQAALKPKPATKPQQKQPDIIINANPQRPVYGIPPRRPGSRLPLQRPPGTNPPPVHRRVSPRQ